MHLLYLHATRRIAPQLEYVLQSTRQAWRSNFVSTLVQTVALDPAHLHGRTHAFVAARSRLAIAAVLTVVIVAPFERTLFTLAGGFTVTTVEAALLMVIGACLAAGVVRPGMWLPAPLLLPGVVFVSVCLVAALAAPIERGNALRFTARMATAVLTGLLVANVADSERRARAIVRTLLATAACVGAIAVLEAANLPTVMNALTAFRPGFHVVAGQLRATSTLFYPTIASMYLEVAFAFGLWLLLDPVVTRRRLERVLALAALSCIGAGIAATFTRAGLFGMFACLALVAALRLARLPRAEADLGILAGLAATLLAIILLSHSPQLLATRLTTEGSQAWYGARYEVPKTLSLETGRTQSIPVSITNTGRLTWDSDRDPPFAMAYHWLRARSATVTQFEGERTAFPVPVRPGTRVTLPVSITAPGEPGAYTLAWDVVHETRAWLSTEGVPSPHTDVVVQGPRTGAVVTTMLQLPGVSVRPARPELWRAAVALAAERPWLGLGPDNFRYVYGRYIGLERWDTRVHANNMYLEVLTGAGVVGLLALVWLVAAAGLALWRRCRLVPAPKVMPAAVALAAWLMIGGHGFVDSFLGFTTTYVTFAVAGGLAFSRGLSSNEARWDSSPVPPESSHPRGTLDADRV